MRLIIHDLEEEASKRLLAGTMNNVTIVSDDDTFHNCIGCFGCWLKTPGTCVIRDSYGDVGKCLSKCAEVIIISKCFYGGFSPFVKKVLDRSISYSHPYFEIRNGEMHHRRRYNNHFDLKVWFYGENVTEQEKQTAEKLILANSINLDCNAHKVTFVKDITEIEGHIE
jgi:multimeric flavodoxin WrbA